MSIKQDLVTIANDTYREFGLFLKEYPDTYSQITDYDEYVYIDFNTNKDFFIQSLFYHQRNLMVIKNITSFPKFGEGYARKMVEATETIAKYEGLSNSFILHNAAPNFWYHMGYRFCDYNLPMIKDLKIISPLSTMHKKL